MPSNISWHATTKKVSGYNTARRHCMVLLQVLKKKLESKDKVSTIQVSVSNKLALKEREWECKFCSGVLTEQSFCLECKKPIDLVCLFCGKKTMYDTHEFCYCQLELLVPRTGGI